MKKLALAQPIPPITDEVLQMRSLFFNVDQLAQEIRRVDGKHSLGAGALAEALMSFIKTQPVQQKYRS